MKPSLHCTARCIHCEPRRSFYRSRGGPTLAFEEYASVIREAVGLGARSLHVSGGEPTLYPHLADLIREGDCLNLYTVLNTNGSLLTPDLAQDLVRGGLRSVIISIHGDSAEKHDAIRQRAGNFDEVIRAVEMLRELRDTSRPKLLISTQTIVTRNNYADLPGIIDLVCRLDVDAHGLSYIEGDFDLEHSLTMEDIGILRNEVLPEVVSRLKRHAFKNVILKWAAIQLVSRLYGGTIERRRDMSRGIYNGKRGDAGCRTPAGFVMILADGSVLPCNMVEYTDGPILGNVKTSRLEEIIHSERWLDFTRNGYDYCRNCPTHMHFHIPISANLRKLLPLARRNPAYEQKSIFRRLSEAM